MKNNWKTYKLGDFAEINPRISLNQGNKYSFVEMKDLDATFKYVSSSIKKELKGGAKFQNGDTLFARITPCLENGKICQVRNLDNNVGFGSTEFLVFRGKKNISDTDFVYYLSRSEFVKNNAIQMMTGSSGRQRVEKSALEELEIQVPDFQTQQKISQILTSLDDKIELNLQMNQTLEAMAQGIFKEWFVDFMFPGFDGELVNSLPKGWIKQKLSSICEIKYGKDHKHLGIGKIPVYGSGGIMRYVDKALYENESILIPRKGTLSNLFYVSEPFWSVDTMFYTIIKEEHNRKYLFYLLKSINLAAMNVGSAVPSLTTEVLNKIEIIIPEITVLIEFENTISSFFTKMEENNSQNKTLTQTRDTLLPNLLSGKIEIKG
jgi:type I restriction enzyme S subunit